MRFHTARVKTCCYRITALAAALPPAADITPADARASQTADDSPMRYAATLAAALAPSRSKGRGQAVRLWWRQHCRSAQYRPASRPQQAAGALRGADGL